MFGIATSLRLESGETYAREALLAGLVRSIDSNARILAALVPNATLYVYPGGHVEPLTAATDFGPRITQILTRQRP